MRILLFCLIGLCLAAHQASATDFTGKLVKVLDGDTVEVLHNGKAERIRLAHIDCPEKGQPFGQSAKRYVLEVAASKRVTVRPDTTDRYGRIVGEIFLPDGSNLNQQIVGAGYAWHYKRYSQDSSYAELERQAQAAKRGLWQDNAPTPPWEWRKGRQFATQTSKSATDFACGGKRYCKEMSSCEEAKFYLLNCGRSSLDGDGDGTPCESLCQ